MVENQSETLEIIHRGGAQTAENYKGIPVHAAPGVHLTVAMEVEKNIGKTGRVLDLGAGQGALSQRLADIGYDVVPVDISGSGWLAKDATVNVVNLDGEWDDVRKLGPFDAICAVEVIEHLENPRDFIRKLLSLSENKTTPVVITTPNPLDTFSSIAFFRRGWFNWFSPNHYGGGGHISILPFWLIDKHLEFYGISDCQWQYVSPFRHGNPLGRVVYNAINFMRKRLTKSDNTDHFDGEAAIGTFHIGQT